MSYPLDKDKPYLVTREMDKEHVQIVGSERIVIKEWRGDVWELGGGEAIWRNYPKWNLLTNSQKKWIKKLRRHQIDPQEIDKIRDQLCASAVAEHSQLRIND